jgi:hypothetical protein
MMGLLDFMRIEKAGSRVSASSFAKASEDKYASPGMTILKGNDPDSPIVIPEINAHCGIVRDP